MKAGELKRMLADVPDDVEILTDASDHNYRLAAVEVTDAMVKVEIAEKALALAWKQRDELVAQLVALFEWQDDPSYLHASLHVANAVRNLRADLVVAQLGAQQAEDAIHVILRQGLVDHEFLDACGCEQCERVRASMVEAGYLPRIVPCAYEVTEDCLDCGHRCTKYCRFKDEAEFDAAYDAARKEWNDGRP